MAVGGVETKDPDEVKLYTMDWTNKLQAGDTIATSVWTITPTGLTIDSDGIVTGGLKTSILLSGGVANRDYRCLNEVTTADGETLQETGLLRVRQR